MSQPLDGQVALVAGATRGAGRGIARELARAGAFVYASGRSIRGQPATGSRPETIEETVELIEADGGQGAWSQTDHTVDEQVEALIERIRREQGRLDIVVNDIGGDSRLTEWQTPFWETRVGMGRKLIDRGVFSHIITSRYALPLMLEAGKGIVVEVTDGDPETNAGYRGAFFYDLAKLLPMRIALALAAELKDTDITAFCITPGFLRSEEVLEALGVTLDNWRDGIEKDPHFVVSESVFYVGRCIATMAADPDVARWAGKATSSWEVAKAYDVRDVDGAQPDWGSYYREHFA